MEVQVLAAAFVDHRLNLIDATGIFFTKIIFLGVLESGPESSGNLWSWFSAEGVWGRFDPISLAFLEAFPLSFRAASFFQER